MSKFSAGFLFISFCIANVAGLESDHDDVVMATLAKLSTDMSNLSKKVTLLEAENERLRDICANEKASDAGISKRLLLMNQVHPSHTKAAFTARLSTHITGLGNQQTIKLDDIVTNIGHCYSANIGTFTAVTNGTYFFFASIMTHLNENLETEIVKNGVRQALMYNYVPNDNDQGVNAVVLALVEGDDVWVRHVDQIGSKVFGGSWSSFSGFQIE